MLALPVLPLFFACGNQPTAPDGSSLLSPSFSFGNNPDNGNPRIVRFERVFALLLTDPQTNLFAIHAGSDDQLAWQLGCSGPPDFLNLVDVQQVVHDPDDPTAGQINGLTLAREIYIAVFQGFDDWAASGFDCADLASRLLADGHGNMTLTDNDIFAFLRENTNANAFGFVVQGNLDRVDGGGAHYNAVSKCVWDGEDGSRIFHCKDKLNYR
jgi:hypothetical protein